MSEPKWGKSDPDEAILKAMEENYKRIEEIAPELNGYVDKETGDAIRRSLKKERERIWEEVNDMWPNWYPEMRKVIFGEEK